MMHFLFLLVAFQALNVSACNSRNVSLTNYTSSYGSGSIVFFSASQLDNLSFSLPQMLFNIPAVWEKPSDEKQAHKIKKRLERRKRYLNRQLKKIDAKARSALTKNNKIKAETFLKKAAEARLGYVEMEQAQKELEQIRISAEKFTFIKNQDDISYTYKNVDGIIVIEFNSYVNAVHELAHAFQHLSGEIEYLTGTGEALYVDIMDEVKAYRRQYFYAPYSFNKLKSDAPLKVETSANIRYFWVSAIYFIKGGKKEYPYKKLKTAIANKPEKLSKE